MTRSYAAIAVLALGLFAARAQAQAPQVDAALRATIIDALIKQMNDYYVFPDVAERVGTALRAKQQRGGYDSITDAETLANVLTADLREAGQDKHLRVSASPTPRSAATGPTPEQREEFQQQMVARGFGIAKTDTLAGNVGYLDVRGFDRINFAAPSTPSPRPTGKAPALRPTSRCRPTKRLRQRTSWHWRS